MNKTCRFIIVFLFIFISGCALSPQVIVVNPELKTDKSSPASKSTKLRVVVMDTRDSNIIGQRGGVYKDTSHISTDENMVSLLERRLATAWNSRGYTVVDKGRDADATLTVRITNIRYVYHTEKALNNVETRVEVQVLCNKSNREYSSTYRSTRKKDVLTTPTEKDNEKIVNEAMALSLEQMLKDKDLVSFIDS